MNQMETDDSTEECAAMSFAQKFLERYETPVSLNICRLADAIKQNCLNPTKKKAIILYLHNENDSFSTLFCSILNKPSVIEILSNNFYVIGWDVEIGIYERTLVETLNNYPQLSNLSYLIKLKTCAALLIVPFNNSVTLHTYMTGIVSEESFILNLRKASSSVANINYGVIAQLSNHQERFNHGNNNVLEEQAALSFTQAFDKDYRNSEVVLHLCSLQDAFTEIVIEEPKILLLYLHNKNDKFSNTFCSNINKPEFYEILHRRFFILGWDTGNETYHQVLLEALNNYIELVCLNEMITTKTSAALIIVPCYDSITLFSCIRGDVTEKVFFENLCNAENFIKQETEQEAILKKCASEKGSENDMGSVKFQQLMCDMLSDRDYDNFEHNQHGLLKEKIGYALYGPPKLESGYDENEKKSIESLFKIILEENNGISKWKDRVVVAFIYNCIEPLPEEKISRQKKYPSDYNPNVDMTPIPMFVLRRCKYSDAPCRIFIDNAGRVYKNWLDFIQNNKLHECYMVLPKNGKYQTDDNDRVLLEKHFSPACSISSKVLRGVDIVGSAAGIVSGGVFVAAAIPAITVAPIALTVAGITGISFGIYSIGRSVYSLYDKGAHNESLSFANSEARGAYLNIVAGSLGFVGAGANMAVAELATRGFNIGTGARAVVNTINIANIGASGVSVANSGYDVIDQWLNNGETPSLLTIVQLSSSILFFGHALYNYRQAGIIVEESQAKTLKAYQESLRSNRHRKTFTKLMKETVKQNNGNVQRGQAEVISTIKRIPNRDEVFAALTRSNKEMNKNGVKFSAQNNQICLNGFAIDMNVFSSMSKESVSDFLRNFGSTHEPTNVEINNVATSLRTAFPGVSFSLSEFTQLAGYCVRIFGNTDGDIKSKIINTLGYLLSILLNKYLNVMKMLDTMFPNNEKYCRLFDVVIRFYETKIEEIETKYEMWQNTEDGKFYETIFSVLSHDKVKRCAQILKFIADGYFQGVVLTERACKSLVEYFFAWFSEKVFVYEENINLHEQRRQNSQPRNSVDCSVCKGIYYQ